MLSLNALIFLYVKLNDTDRFHGNLLQDYNFTLEFYMSPFLTELDRSHQSGRKVLILDKISSFSNQWIGADIMIFNSGNWWTHNDAIKV